MLRAINRFTSPLLIDDYLELINPLWSSRELRGKVVEINRETEDASTIVIKPGWEWEGHEPGQYLRIGLDIEGVRHWRAYSLTSDPASDEDCISITVKHAKDGKVSPYLVRKLREGTIVSLGEVTGEFKLPDEVPEKLLFISAGSGITPIKAMINDLADKDELVDAIHIHSARGKDDVIFGDQLRKLGRRRTTATPSTSTTRAGTATTASRPTSSTSACPTGRSASPSPPARRSSSTRCASTGRSTATRTCSSSSASSRPTARAARRATAAPSSSRSPTRRSRPTAGSRSSSPARTRASTCAYGCRMGICHTCVGKCVSGKVRDLRSGEVMDAEGQTIRICINAPEGPVEVEL